MRPMGSLINPLAATATTLGVAGMVWALVNTVLRHRREVREPSRLLAERFATDELTEREYLDAAELLGHMSVELRR